MVSPNKSVITGVIILVIILVGAGVWWYAKNQTAPLPEGADTAKSEGGLGAQIFEGAQNPLKNDVPETNPFAAPTNPFKQETNPYKDTYKNPF